MQSRVFIIYLSICVRLYSSSSMVTEKYLRSMNREFCVFFFQDFLKVSVAVIQEIKVLNRDLAVFSYKGGTGVLLSSKQNKRVLSLRINKNLKKKFPHQQNTFIRFWGQKYQEVQKSARCNYFKLVKVVWNSDLEKKNILHTKTTKGLFVSIKYYTMIEE